ncbi:NAD-binding protein [Peptoniphilus sp.]|uniref:NAD-binding protein n=1 Tax=Peptoniphilus sp. TaxID=1971214 RepID=UPI003D930C84
MKILIIGAGKVGSTIANTLILEDFEIDIIDRDADNFTGLSNKINYFVGDVLNGKFLSKFVLESYDYVIVTTDSDKTNLIIASVLKDVNTNVILRLDELENVSEINYLKNAFDNVVNVFNKSLETGKILIKLIGNYEHYQADYFGKGKIEVAGHLINYDKEFENIKIKDVGSLATILVVGIFRDGRLIVPNGDTVLMANDYIYLMGLSRDIRNFKMTHFELPPSKDYKDVVIASGDGIVNEMLSNLKNTNVKIIEPDRVKAKEYRNKNTSAFVVNKSLKNEKLFEDENIKEDATFISMTSSDELNIVLGLMAKAHGIKSNIVVQNVNNYSKILDPLEIHRIVDPKVLVANEIVKSIDRGMKLSINFMFGGKARVYEIKIPDDFVYIDKKLKDIDLGDGIIIGGIIRYDNSAVIPRGNTEIKKGDRLVIFCTNESRKELEKLIDPSLRRSIFEFFRR